MVARRWFFEELSGKLGATYCCVSKALAWDALILQADDKATDDWLRACVILKRNPMWSEIHVEQSLRKSTPYKQSS